MFSKLCQLSVMISFGAMCFAAVPAYAALAGHDENECPVFASKLEACKAASDIREETCYDNLRSALIYCAISDPLNLDTECEDNAGGAYDYCTNVDIQLYNQCIITARCAVPVSKPKTTATPNR